MNYDRDREADYPNPPDNAAFEDFDPAFQDRIDAKFQTGIKLAETNRRLAIYVAEFAQARRVKAQRAHAAIHAETLDRARRRVRS
jgi:hypothetical protein